jgi:hypothetical protein
MNKFFIYFLVIIFFILSILFLNYEFSKNKNVVSLDYGNLTYLFDLSENKTCFITSVDLFDGVSVQFLSELKCGGVFGWKKIGNVRVVQCGYSCNPFLPASVIPEGFFEINIDSRTYELQNLCERINKVKTLSKKEYALWRNDFVTLNKICDDSLNNFFQEKLKNKKV